MDNITATDDDSQKTQSTITPMIKFTLTTPSTTTSPHPISFVSSSLNDETNETPSVSQPPHLIEIISTHSSSSEDTTTAALYTRGQHCHALLHTPTNTPTPPVHHFSTKCQSDITAATLLPSSHQIISLLGLTRDGRLFRVPIPPQGSTMMTIQKSHELSCTPRRFLRGRDFLIGRRLSVDSSSAVHQDTTVVLAGGGGSLHPPIVILTCWSHNDDDRGAGGGGSVETVALLEGCEEVGERWTRDGVTVTVDDSKGDFKNVTIAAGFGDGSVGVWTMTLSQRRDKGGSMSSWGITTKPHLVSWYKECGGLSNNAAHVAFFHTPHHLLSIRRDASLQQWHRDGDGLHPLCSPEHVENDDNENTVTTAGWLPLDNDVIAILTTRTDGSVRVTMTHPQMGHPPPWITLPARREMAQVAVGHATTNQWAPIAFVTHRNALCLAQIHLTSLRRSFSDGDEGSVGPHERVKRLLKELFTFTERHSASRRRNELLCAMREVRDMTGVLTSPPPLPQISIRGNNLWVRPPPVPWQGWHHLTHFMYSVSGYRPLSLPSGHYGGRVVTVSSSQKQYDTKTTSMEWPFCRWSSSVAKMFTTSTQKPCSQWNTTGGGSMATRVARDPAGRPIPLGAIVPSSQSDRERLGDILDCVTEWERVTLSSTEEGRGFAERLVRLRHGRIDEDDSQRRLWKGQGGGWCPVRSDGSCLKEEGGGVCSGTLPASLWKRDGRVVVSIDANETESEEVLGNSSTKELIAVVGAIPSTGAIIAVVNYNPSPSSQTPSLNDTRHPSSSLQKPLPNKDVHFAINGSQNVSSLIPLVRSSLLQRIITPLTQQQEVRGVVVTDPTVRSRLKGLKKAMEALRAKRRCCSKEENGGGDFVGVGDYKNVDFDAALLLYKKLRSLNVPLV